MWTKQAQHQNHQQMEVTGSSEAPDMMLELLLDIVYQNKFMPFTGLSKNLIIGHIHSARMTQPLIYNNIQKGETGLWWVKQYVVV